MKRKRLYKVLGGFIIITVFVFIMASNNKTDTSIQTSTGVTKTREVSNKKIGWGIRRGDNHNQPDLGTRNRQLIEQYEGIAIGNGKDKRIYLTFDEGYEAGYTEQILNILKENDVKATFFITGHYLNSKPELVKRMINEGHIVRKPYSKSL